MKHKKMMKKREMGLYVKEERQDAARKNTLENIKSLMETMKLSAKEAMNALQIAPNDQKIKGKSEMKRENVCVPLFRI